VRRLTGRRLNPPSSVWHTSRALALAGVLTFICAQPAGAAMTQGFVDSPSQLTIAPWASANGVWIDDTSCGSAGSCVATGSYDDPAGNVHPFLVQITSGIPGSGSEVSLPADAAASSDVADLASVSCWSASSCFAVGTYENASDNFESLVAPISNGAPGAGVGIQLPSNARPATESSLSEVDCWAAGSCVAIGSYTDQDGNTQALVEPISGGTAGAGIEVPAPAGAEPSPNLIAGLNEVDCWAAGACVATGSYSDANGDDQAFVVPISNGVPGAAVAVTPPSDAATPASGTTPDVSLGPLSCWGAGSCVAVGSYATAADNIEGMVVPITDGVPGTASDAQLPANAATANSEQQVSLDDVSCSTDGHCVAVGRYLLPSQIDQEALVEPITDGVPGPGQDVSLPGNAGTGWQEAGLESVSCPAAGPCVGIGDYTDSSHDMQELTAAISGGVAQTGVEPPTFADESTSSLDNALLSVGCASSGSCLVLGIYANTSGIETPTVFGMQSPLSIGTSSLPPTTTGASYDSTLSASGAWGAYSWSLASGNLPAGLSLNSQTGVISGTPTTAGTSTFTVEATGTGTPAQTATQALSITVAAPAPHIGISGGRLPVKSNRLTVKLSCSGSTCKGTVKVAATEVVTIKHGKRKVKQHRTVVIGSAHFSVAAGHSASATITLNKTGRSLLSKAKGHKLAVKLLATATGGNTATHSATLWMKVAKKKRKG
jgi:hypothetical protein